MFEWIFILVFSACFLIIVFSLLKHMVTDLSFGLKAVLIVTAYIIIVYILYGLL